VRSKPPNPNRRHGLRNAAKVRPSTHMIRGGNSAEVI
jgi:hypothetical protein